MLRRCSNAPRTVRAEYSCFEGCRYRKTQAIALTSPLILNHWRHHGFCRLVDAFPFFTGVQLVASAACHRRSSGRGWLISVRLIQMTGEEYWHIYEVVHGDLDITISSITTYLTINRAAARDVDAFTVLNREAEFWRIVSYSLQEAFFLGLGRLFDERRNTIGVEDLVDATIEHRGFFTREEMKARKLSQIHLEPGEHEPEWLIDFVKQAWQPQRGDLEYLRTELQPYIERFRQVHGPIRHQYFAHRSKLCDAAIGELFEKAVIDESIEILKFLKALTHSIWDLAWNGEKPDLKGDHGYEGYADLVGRKASDLIQRLKNC